MKSKEQSIKVKEQSVNQRNTIDKLTNKRMINTKSSLTQTYLMKCNKKRMLKKKKKKTVYGEDGVLSRSSTEFAELV